MRLGPLLIAVFGFLSIAGGIMGFIKADSLPSLIMGSIGGLLLLTCSLFIAKGSRICAIMVLLISSIYLCRFFPAYLKTYALVPHLAMVICSLIASVIAIFELANAKARA